MKELRFLMALGILLGLALFSQTARAGQEFEISCEGARCNGGGTWHYQYTLKNVSGITVTLEDFILGTQDINEGNYTFAPTAGFTASVVENGVPANMTFTTKEETPHGDIPPQSGGEESSANVWWQGSRVIPNHGAIKFGFDHPSEPWDQEWFAFGSQPGQSTISQIDSPMAGPSGVFTDGWVHAPGSEAAGGYSVSYTHLRAHET